MVQISVPPTPATIASLCVNRPLEVFTKICELKEWVFNRRKDLRLSLIGFRER